MSTTLEPMLAEIEQESQATRRLLERIPAEKLGWAPHPKSMTLGQLALHVATMPRAIVELLSAAEIDLDVVDLKSAKPSSKEEVLAELDNALGEAQKGLRAYDDARAASTWRIRKGTTVLMEAPRAALLRTLLCNHLYHHRGQLTVYLRLLDVALPTIYGPSADENPFA